MWINDEAIMKDLRFITFNKISDVAAIDKVVVILITALHVIFIKTTKGRIFCQVIKMRLLNQEIDFLIFIIQL